ncbi:MAG: TrmH family RNA methyltransferase [bacterium]|nr:TrmH family RNA methyltransferase [bacterium]
MKSRNSEQKPIINNRSVEERYCGRNACLAIWNVRPQEIIKIYLEQSNFKNFAACLKWCAEKKIAYKVVSFDELDKVTQATHHEGICIIAKKRTELDTEKFLSQIKDKKLEAPIVLVDGLKNPHNFGSVLRSCANFGVKYVIGDQEMPKLSAAACRVAEGGAEHLNLVRTDNLGDILMRLKKSGFSIISTSSHAKASIFSTKFPAKTVLVMGSESVGISRRIEDLSDQVLSIPSSGSIQSLNVSTATSIILAEFWRQTHI